MNAALVFEGARLIATIVPLAIDSAMKIKLLLEQSKDYRVEIKELADSAISANEETIALIEQWKKVNGIT